MRRPVGSAVLALALILWALASSAVLAADPVPPAFRLDGSVAPIRYDLQLTVDPRQGEFSGGASIQVSLAEPTDFIWINASRLTLTTARAVPAGSRDGLSAEVVKGNDDFVGLRFSRALPAGEALLWISWTGEISSKDTRGLFRLADAGEWYAFTHMEPLSARRVFPGFDEPRWKTPWRIKLTIPEDMQAFANAPVEWERAASPGWREVGFATTDPLPSYLVAFAVGNFDVVDAGTAGAAATRIRLLTPKGRGGEAAYARSISPPVLAAVERYFGEPYPYRKLDLVAMPTPAFGAMENPGLITFSQRLMLARQDQADPQFQRWFTATLAHEIAHMWFGNLVTLAWWDDLWLNESFAQWLGNRITAELKPEWRWGYEVIGERLRAIDVDRLRSTRRIRQPIARRDDILAAFDAITYSKGGAVLGMFESWLGPERFQAGVRRYLSRHRHGNATAEDFFGALAAENAAVLPGFRSFVDRPGVPEITTALDCANDGVRVRVTQRRFQPVGAAPIPAEPWVMPVCFRYPEGTGTRSHCALVDRPEATIALPADTCPAWLLANRGGIGYFLASPEPGALTRLAQASRALAPEDIVPLLADVRVLARGGRLALSEALEAAAAFAGHPDPAVAEASLEIARDVHPELLEAKEAARFATWVRRHYGARARSVGWVPRRNEPEGTPSLRHDLLPFVAKTGNDPVLAAQARDLARRWVSGRLRLPAREASVFVSAGAAGVPEAEAGALFDLYLAAFHRRGDPVERSVLLEALGGFPAASLRRRAFDLVLSDQTSYREAFWPLIRIAGRNHATRGAAYDWLKANFDPLVERAPDQAPGWWPTLFSGFCSAGARADVEEFFGARAARHPGTDHNLRQTLEAIDLCVAYRNAQRPSLVEFLQKVR